MITETQATILQETATECRKLFDKVLEREEFKQTKQEMFHEALGGIFLGLATGCFLDAEVKDDERIIKTLKMMLQFARQTPS